MASPSEQRDASASRPLRARRRRLLAGLALAFLTAFAFAGVLELGFVVDDREYVETNTALETTDGLVAIWTDLEALPHVWIGRTLLDERCPSGQGQANRAQEEIIDGRGFRHGSRLAGDAPPSLRRRPEDKSLIRLDGISGFP